MQDTEIPFLGFTKKAEDSKTDLGIKFGPRRQKLWHGSPCQTDGQSSCRQLSAIPFNNTPIKTYKNENTKNSWPQIDSTPNFIETIILLWCQSGADSVSFNIYLARPIVSSITDLSLLRWSLQYYTTAIVVVTS